jgi:hypothetical protein
MIASVIPEGFGRFVVYTRDEERIRQLKQTIIDQLLRGA